MEVNLVSINTWKCDGDYHRRLEILAKQLQVLDPDVVCCQEVFASIDGQVHTGAHLAKALDLKLDFFPTRRKERALEGRIFDSYSGLCLLTRVPVDKRRHWHLPSHPRDGERTAQFMSVSTANTAFAIVNTHLTHLRDVEGLRQQQMEELLLQLRASSAGRFLIVGDLNMSAESQVFRDVTSNHGLTDIFAKSVAPTHVSGHRIDHVLSFGNLLILEKAVVLNEPEDGILPSDHFGLMVKFRV